MRWLPPGAESKTPGAAQMPSWNVNSNIPKGLDTGFGLWALGFGPAGRLPYRNRVLRSYYATRLPEFTLFSTTAGVGRRSRRPTAETGNQCATSLLSFLWVRGLTLEACIC